jgi:hypothetical protein
MFNFLGANRDFVATSVFGGGEYEPALPNNEADRRNSQMVKAIKNILDQIRKY